MKPKSTNRAVQPAAWSAVLAEVFLAVGAGDFLGDTAFRPPTVGYDAWHVGLPSIWAWTITFWALGILLIGFLSYEMEPATASGVEITPLEPAPSVAFRGTKIQEQEMLRLGWPISEIAARTKIATWIFGEDRKGATQ